MLEISVKVNLSGLKRFRAEIDRQLGAGSSDGPVNAALKQWAARYRAFLQRRYVRASRGGGIWPPLKHPERRRGSGKRVGKQVDTAAGTQKLIRAAVLRDTGTLFNVVSPSFTGAPGQLQKKIPFGVRVGYGGPSRHPKARATVADIASFHQVGAGVLPKREIIVPPDTATLQQMAADMDRALKKLAGE